MNSSIGLHSGIVCTAEQYARSKSDSSIHCLTRGESIGLTVVAEAGLLSLVAVSYVLTIILRNFIWRFRNATKEERSVFHEPMDLLMFSLFSADALQALGAVMDIKWVQEGKVEAGGFCNAQGIVQQLGETGVAMTTLTIAVYTFLGVWLGKSIRSMFLTKIILSLLWSFITLMIIIGNTIRWGSGKPHYLSPTPYWCWISEDYLQMRIIGEYFWFWITLAFSFAIYVPLWLWSRGNINIDEHHWWKFSFRRAELNTDPVLKGFRRRSLIMLAYPFVYCVSILPFSVGRWVGFVQERNGGTNRVPSTATLAVTALFGLSGVCNVILLLTTRPALFGRYSKFSSSRPPSIVTTDDDGHTRRGVPDKEENELGRLPTRL
ncbi:hypothetical protein GALMADRAFT_69346 [Galerina marginata CBS 339.88]|uniref:Uncharacterized protein n=1 Tax=Galerina marginata (strain CBS 339.88) TaxID=685588 RepID=A0A067SYA2_GALM3|nr:hypothetical protein GALMADRAFT_69346 [Galerina marginata CBS 339.88]